jgi:hypothetical protein
MKKILAVGPFVGNFEQEIMTFQPYARWLSEIIGSEDVYLSTHSNRTFLYDFIPSENIISVFEDLSRDELGQKGYIHESLLQKDYNILLRKFKDDIIERSSCSKKDIDIYFLNYVKSTPPYPMYNKVFKRIPVTEGDNGGNGVILIPHRNEKKSHILYDIYKHLNDKYGCSVMGDMTSDLPGLNKVFGLVDYFENGWKYIMRSINEAKAVICPISFWTTICNLQGANVFSWGEQVGQHKEHGIYYFNNKKLMTVPTQNDTDAGSIIKMIDYFLEKL